MALTRNDTAPLFSPDTANTLRLIVYLALAIGLMVSDHRNGWLTRVRYAASVAIEPMYRLASLPSQLARDAGDAVADRTRLNARNAELERELLLAQARLNRLQTVREQNERLQQLLDAQRSLDVGVQLARIIDVDTDPFRHRVVVDAGVRQGVTAGEAVLDAHGVMGQIVEVLPDTSTVMLITDPAHALPVKSERTGLRAIARGTGKVRWMTQLDEFKKPKKRVNRIFWTGPVLAGNRLWIANSRGQVFTVDVLTGKPTPFMDLKKSISLGPIVANQTLYILDDGGTIHAYR